MEVITPSRVPNSESIPRVNSMRKNKTDQKGAAGNWLMASVNTMKARPVPELDCFRGQNEDKDVISLSFRRLQSELGIRDDPNFASRENGVKLK